MDSKARFKRMLFMACLASAAFLFVAAVPALAQNTPDTIQNFGLDSEFSNVAVQSDRDIKEIAARVINIGLGFLGIVAVIIILYAGYLWMTAAGNEEQVAKAKLVMRNAVIGLVIIFMSWGIATFVIRQLGSATGVGGGTGGGAGSLLPGSGNIVAFRVDSFETSHDGDDASQNVQLCSNIQAQFNHWLNAEMVENLANGDTLTIKRNSGGTFIDEGTILIEKRNNVITFKRIEEELDEKGKPVRVDWTPNAEYEVRLDETLRDARGLVLSGCADCGGTRDGYHFWTFTTGTTRDSVAPSLAVAYPGNGDANVPRSTLFSIEFSEAIDATTVLVPPVGVPEGEEVSDELIAASIFLQPRLTDGTYGPAIPSSAFDASFKNSRLEFRLNGSHVAVYGDGPYLEPYTEYRLTIQNVADLCGNELAPPVEIMFTTGADIPGVSFVRPSGGFGHACSATPVFAQFRTSMYNVRTQSCGVDANGNAGLALGGALGPAGVGLRLLPEDNFFGLGNPNDFCKQYYFNLDPNDAADDLIPDTEYSASVSFIEPGGDVSSPESHNWAFTVAPAGQCADEPYINYISTGLGRNQGQWEQCLTVAGRYFGGAKAGASSGHTALSLDSPRNLPLQANVVAEWQDHPGLEIADRAWSDASIAGNFIGRPSESIPGGASVDFDIAVSVEHPQPIGTLKSNEVRFTVDTTQTFNGPCLYSINPVSGFWGDSVALSGSNLGSGQTDTLTFYDNKTRGTTAITELGGSWGQSRIMTSVPNQATNNPADGEVYVTAGGVQSNKLEFDLQAGIGQSCALDPDMCAPGLECNSETLTCQVPDMFRVTSVAPASACTDSCTNAIISFETSKPIAEAGGNRVQIKKCPSGERCAWSDPGATLVAAQASLNGAQSAIITPQATGGLLDLGSWYMVHVAGGPQGVVATDGKTLANLNADTDAVAGEDAYVWSFKTGGAACGVNRAELGQSAVTVYEGENAQLSVRAYGPANSCAPGGQELVAPNNFSWKACKYLAGDIAAECNSVCAVPTLPSGDSILSVAASASAQTTLTAENGSRNGTAKALACMFYNDGTVSLADGAAATVYAACNTDTDCQQGGSCADSVCLRQGDNAGKCTPVVNDFNPKNGAAGTWVTIDGCYFGNEWGEVEIGREVMSGPPAEALQPSVAWCSATWSDTQIIAEVGSFASASGPVRVERADGELNSSAADYIPDVTRYPGLCRVSPRQGRPGAIVELRGKEFGETKAATDIVLFTDFSGAAHIASDIVDSETKASCPADGWGSEQICIRVAAADPGAATVKVIAASQNSNTVVFTILGHSSNTPGVEGLMVSSYTPGDGSQACRNMVVEAVVDGRLVPESANFESGDMASDSPDASFYVRKASDHAVVAGMLGLDTRAGQTTFRLYPDAELAFETNYQIVLKGGGSGLLSASGGMLDTSSICDTQTQVDALSLGDCVINFRTVDAAGDDQCKITHFKITPSSPMFTCAGQGNCEGDVDVAQFGHQRIFTATAMNQMDQPATANSALEWSSSKTAILSKANPIGNGAPTDAELQQRSQALFHIGPSSSAIPVSNGSSIISVRADIDGANIAGATEARVFICENPWPVTMAADGVPFSDTEATDFTSKDVYTNFSTFYCRDKGEPGTADDLPYLSMRHEVGSGEARDVDGLLKEVFFVQPNSTDAIGIRALANSENVSIREWYDSKGYNGNPQSITPLGGFSALQDGRTIYVSALNDTLNPSHSIYNNIYLISVSDQSSLDTMAIFNQLVSNWRFLANITDDNEQAKLKRDAVRIEDAHAVARLLQGVAPPTLVSGSYQKGLSLSTWPSWSANLSSDFGTSLPVDPLNEIQCDLLVSPANPETCWTGGASPGYSCNAGTQAYLYLYRNQNGLATFSTNLEYAPAASWNTISGSGWNTSPGEWCMSQGLRYETSN
ncbi:MAG: Ig-like domain-containing protein [bacterium]|nr:Ig-like domain-containing protein [bacterium]